MVDANSVPRIALNNGLSIPAIGLGTWQSNPDGSVYRAVRAAITAGYRHLDCAFIYQNEEEIGRAIADAIKDGEVKREDLFVTSKIWLTYFAKDRVPVNANKILAALQFEYVDLLLLHWPFSFKQTDETLFPVDSDGNIIDGRIDYLQAYEGLQELHKQGLAKSIGVSNFTVEQLKRLLANASIKPVINQVESHPYLVQQELKDYCKANGIIITAYSPLGNPGSSKNPALDKDKLLKDAVVNKLATKYGKNVGQILIKFQLAIGNVVIPKSVTKERIESNIQVLDFDLTPEEVSELLALDRNYRAGNFEICSKLSNYPFK